MIIICHFKTSRTIPESSIPSLAAGRFWSVILRVLARHSSNYKFDPTFQQSLVGGIAAREHRVRLSWRQKKESGNVLTELDGSNGVLPFKRAGCWLSIQCPVLFHGSPSQHKQKRPTR